jgi:isoquinoline 1-oxidoreductase beta subunit
VPDAASIQLRAAADFRIIGKRFGRLDTPVKSSGQAVYGIDVRVRGMLYSVVARCPYLGGRLESHDAARALQVPGVRQVVVLRSFGAPLHLRGGVAVVADSTWAALEGRKALVVNWNPGPNAAVSSASIRESHRAAAATRGKVTTSTGDVDAAFAASTPVLAEFEYPYLAHATMEPNNCTVAISGDRAEVWAPTQYPPNALSVAAAVLQMEPDRVTLHVPFLGGGFGRRINEDFVGEAALSPV